MSRLSTLPQRLCRPPAGRCQVQGDPDSWRAGLSSAARGYGHKWRKARAAYLAHHPHCVMCLAELGMMDLDPADVILACARRGLPEPVATVVDHVIAHRGDKALFWDHNNWQPLCKAHHDSDAQRRDKEGHETAGATR